MENGSYGPRFLLLSAFLLAYDWRGQSLALTVPAAMVKVHTGQGCAVFLQKVQKGLILGSASIQLAQNVN